MARQFVPGEQFCVFTASFAGLSPRRRTFPSQLVLASQVFTLSRSQL